MEKTKSKWNKRCLMVEKSKTIDIFIYLDHFQKYTHDDN